MSRGRGGAQAERAGRKVNTKVKYMMEHCKKMGPGERQGNQLSNDRCGREASISINCTDTLAGKHGTMSLVLQSHVQGGFEQRETAQKHED